MNIYIFIEIKRRELSARLLLALEAANRGHEVYMGDISPFLKRNLFNPGIIHHKSLTPKKNRIKDMINLNKKSFVFTSQDEETGLINPAKDYLNSRYGAATLKLVKKVFTWGKFDLENLMKRYPQFKKKFFNTGNPRTDFWKAKNKNFYDKNIVKYKDYILISSNFETICSYMNLPVTLNLLRDLGYFQRGMTEEQIINKATKEQIIFEKFVALIKKISLKFPKKKIIFRPHPIEKVQYWKIIFEKYKKNIVVDNSNEIGYWITNCSHVIHNGCTGGMEAALRGKKVIAFSPNNLNIGFKFPNQLSKKFSSSKGILNILRNYSNKLANRIIKKNENEIGYRLQNYYNEDAYKNIVNEWDKLFDKKLTKKNNLKKIKILTKLLRVKLCLKGYKNLNNKFSDFTKKEINFTYNNLCKINKDFKNINVELLSGKLLRVYRK